MNTKLTLLLDDDVIKKAKDYSKSNETSLSKLVEEYFKALSEIQQKHKVKTSTIVSEIAGILKVAKISEDDYTDYLIEKYK
ncbi:MAG: hypothetical protein KKD38_01215 [Candidatus Delongbacteria bacterium]|nr:hypothetical protein [Candidatus Delongbacteria bacterium]MCG2759863.1 DUF6364 family protein [Candidatus Delongbacteria bacterium]